jgi:hypothetical protein
MRVHDVYKNALPSLLNNGSLHYDSSRHYRIDQEVLCYGPYAVLERGLYHCSLVGSLEGQVRLRVTSGGGKEQHGEWLIDDLTEKRFFQLQRRADQCEILIIRTAGTLRLNLESICLDRHHLLS